MDEIDRQMRIQTHRKVIHGDMVQNTEPPPMELPVTEIFFLSRSNTIVAVFGWPTGESPISSMKVTLIFGIRPSSGLRNHRIIRRKTKNTAEDRKISAVTEMGIRKRFVIMDRLFSV